jgi:NAD(P)-dependent dehydrogenase (short-subunit alcohol dehydrogenase family)
LDTDSGLSGKIAVVTGAARGIGYACGVHLAACGVEVVAIDLDLAPVRDSEHVSVSIECDLTVQANVSAAFAEIHDKLGGLDILVNVAGGALTPFDASFASQMSSADFSKLIDVNLMSTVYCSQAAVPIMRARGRGSIIATSSIAGFGPPSDGSLVGYAISKAAISGFVQMLSNEVAPQGIRVNAIAPGLIDTERVRRVNAGNFASESQAKSIPLRRLGRPQDVANAVEFLAGDQSSYITGQTIFVSGGLTGVPQAAEPL